MNGIKRISFVRKPVLIATRKLLMHHGFRRYAVNTSWMMAEQLLRIVAGLFVGIWVARYLGPEQFGLFSYIVAFTAIFGGIAKLGLDSVMVRELVNQPGMRNKYLGTAFWLKFGGALLVIALIAAIVPFTSNDAITNLYIFIIAAGLVFQSFEVVEFYFQSQVLAKIISICKIAQLALSSIIKVYLVLTQAELIWFVVTTAFDAMSLAISYFIAYRLLKNASFYKFFDPQVARGLLRDSWPLIFSSLVVMVYMRIDQVMIKEMLGGYEVGIYSAAVRLSEVFYFIPVFVTASVFPAIINAKMRSEDQYIERLQSLYAFLAWIAIAIALLTTFLSDWLIFLLYGELYQSAAKVLVIHVWGAVFVSIGVAFTKHLVTENLTKISLYRAALGAVLNVILNLFLIPSCGIHGAALAMLFSQIIANIGYDIFDKKLHGQLVMKIKALFYPFLWCVR